ncbi:MAG: decarboxylase [Rhizobiales bacterium]|nr:decarboxylase [Hyphomicrobiales bacterium]
MVEAARHGDGACGGAPFAAPSGEAIIAELKRASVRFVVALPDIVTSDGLLWPISRDPDFKLVRICKEDEGVSICAAMSYTGTRAVLMMQQTGLMDSLNAVRAIAMDYELPICMMVGLQGKEPHLRSRQSASYGVRIVEPILDVMGLGYTAIEEPKDVSGMAATIDEAYAHSRAHCFLIGRAPTFGSAKS